MVKATSTKAGYFHEVPRQKGIEDTTLELEKLIKLLRAAYYRATQLKAYESRDERSRAEFERAVTEVEGIKEDIDNKIKKLEWLLSEL